MSDYVSRDVLDAELARQAAEYEKRCTKLEAAFQLHRVKNKKDIELLRKDVELLRGDTSHSHSRIDDIKDYVTWGFASLGFGVAVLGIIIAVLQFFKH